MDQPRMDFIRLFFIVTFFFQGPHSLCAHLKNTGISLSSFTWEAQKAMQTRSEVTYNLQSWLMSKRATEVYNSTIANLVTSGKHFVNFLRWMAEGDVPTPGAPNYPLYTIWDDELKRAAGVLDTIGKKSYPKRKEEAHTNRQRELALDTEVRRKEVEALKNVPNHPKMKAIMSEAKEIPFDPDLATTGKVDQRMYNQTLEALGILLLLGGQRPEVITFLRESDVCSIKQNEVDPDLYTMTLDTFSFEKRGKTKTEIRLSMDAQTYNMLLKFKTMRKVMGVTAEELLTYPDGTLCTGQRLKKSATWASLDLPTSINFRKIRQNVSTFVALHPETTDLSTNVMLNHGKEMNRGPYAVKNQEVFDKGSSAIRASFLPKSKAPLEREEKKEMKAQMLQNRKELRRTLDFERGAALGRRCFATSRPQLKGYALMNKAKGLLLRAILECRVPEYTYALLTAVPRDTAQVTKKPWTELTSRFLLHKANKDLLTAILEPRPSKPEDAYDVCKTIRNTLTTFNKVRRTFPGFDMEPRKIRVKEKARSNPFYESSDDDDDDKRDRAPSSEPATTTSPESEVSPLKRSMLRRGGQSGWSGKGDCKTDDDSDEDPDYRPEKRIRLRQGRSIIYY